jgi:hypothetical protein
MRRSRHITGPPAPHNYSCSNNCLPSALLDQPRGLVRHLAAQFLVLLGLLANVDEAAADGGRDDEGAPHQGQGGEGVLEEEDVAHVSDDDVDVADQGHQGSLLVLETLVQRETACRREGEHVEY